MKRTGRTKKVNSTISFPHQKTIFLYENVVGKLTHIHTYKGTIKLHNIDQIKFQFIKLELTFLHFKSRSISLASFVPLVTLKATKKFNYRFKSASAFDNKIQLHRTITEF